MVSKCGGFSLFFSGRGIHHRHQQFARRIGLVGGVCVYTIDVSLDPRLIARTFNVSFCCYWIYTITEFVYTHTYSLYIYFRCVCVCVWWHTCFQHVECLSYYSETVSSFSAWCQLFAMNWNTAPWKEGAWEVRRARVRQFKRSIECIDTCSPVINTEQYKY